TTAHGPATSSPRVTPPLVTGGTGSAGPSGSHPPAHPPQRRMRSSARSNGPPTIPPSRGPSPAAARRAATHQPPPAPSHPARRPRPGGSGRSSVEPRPRSPSRAFRPGANAGAAWHTRKRRNTHVMTEHTGHPPARQHPESVAVGIEEEFHVVGLRTRRLAAQAG